MYAPDVVFNQVVSLKFVGIGSPLRYFEVLRFCFIHTCVPMAMVSYTLPSISVNCPAAKAAVVKLTSLP